MPVGQLEELWEVYVQMTLHWFYSFMKDYTTSALMFSLLLFFFHCIQKKFIHLSWMLTLPIPPLPLPTLAFQIKNCKPFPNLSMNWHFCQIQSSSSLLLKKRKTTQRGQHQYHIFGVPEQALPGGYWGPCLYVILYRLFSYTVLLPIKASWKKQTWPWQPSIGDYYWHEYGNFMSIL